MFATTAAVIFFAAEASRLTVHYYNEAKVSRNALVVAVATADHALRQAGVTAHWVDCYTAATGSCKSDVGSAFIELTISAPSDQTPALKGTSNFTMGLSLLPENGTGVYAKVLWNRVTRFAKAHDIPVALVLGNVMAHEIGHLLMNTATHSPAGIMKAGWSGRDKSLLSRGAMSFQGHEGALMRCQLASFGPSSGGSPLQRARPIKCGPAPPASSQSFSSTSRQRN